jgi:hypothetical protein
MVYRRIFAAVAFLMVALIGAAPALEPPRGSAVRAAIIDALRVRVEFDLGAPIMFKVSALNVEGRWAFVSARPTRPGSEAFDWSRTRYARQIASDTMSDVIQGLLRADGARWVVVEYALGPTDVPWESWATKHRIARRFFESAYSAGVADDRGPNSDAAAQPQAAPAASPSSPSAAAGPAPGMRRWSLGEISFETPQQWQSLDSAQARLKFGGAPWNATFSDRAMDSGRGALLIFSWADDDYIFSRGLDPTNLLGTQPASLGGVAARKTDRKSVV